ncbi:TPA: hypothetical protein GDO54_018461 [Pyxicephalus adspersus]|uniref:Olfactory receptor n=1 Tax=Pyxicephalus adspersus TaxID=30357 RepID=A0AAV2ZDC6_PYXAD|nr:TPA: hypothetical protein GDO54_018462 [Pyxicephalus adspersus]DBA13499.1 TPA: hypothetical protein GDO54_018461 [Pyxicephalus adspersus]
MLLLNGTLQGGFILLGFHEYTTISVLLFFIFLSIYLLCFLENTILILVIYLDSHLHNPMYFFLGNLSFLDICFTSLIFPRFLLTFLDLRLLSYLQCMTQVYLFITLQSAELLILTVMSYDRYVAICNPLHYNIILNTKVCVLLAVLTWVIGIVDPAPLIILMSYISFCKLRIIDHLFCDLVPLLELSCDDVSKVEALIVFEGGSVVVSAFIFTLISYIFIIQVIIRIQSKEGRKKAFSTCSSHLSVIVLLYLSLIFVYLQQPSKHHSQNTKFISILNTGVIPMLNPLLYSLRNAKVKAAFYRYYCWKNFRIRI